MSFTGTRTYLYSVLAAPGSGLSGTRTYLYSVLAAGSLATVTGPRTFNYQVRVAVTPAAAAGLHRVVRATIAGKTVTLRLLY